MKFRDIVRHPRYEIDGETFNTVAAIHRVCVEKGFDGSNSTIYHRIKSGVRNWAELVKPISHQLDAALSERIKRNQRAKEEMARICADLDARKNG